MNKKNLKGELFEQLDPKNISVWDVKVIYSNKKQKNFNDFSISCW